MDKRHTMATKERMLRGRRFSDQLMAGVLRVFSRMHIPLYRWTGGFIGGRIFGNRMLLLTTTGRKTGQPRTTPVAYLADGDALVIVDWPAVRSAFYPVERVFVPLIEIEQFVLLRHAR